MKTKKKGVSKPTHDEFAKKQATIIEVEKEAITDLLTGVKQLTTSQIITNYTMLRLKYVVARHEYNYRSPSMTKRERNGEYLSLVYKQGCLKALEAVLGIEEEAASVKVRNQA